MRGLAVWMWTLEHCDGGDTAKIARRLKENGVKWLIGPKAWDHGNLYGRRNWREVVAELKVHYPELKVCSWGYCWPDSHGSDAQRAVDTVKAGADAIMLDVEVEFKGHADEAKRLVDRIRRDMDPKVPVYFSSLAFPRWHQAFPWAAFSECDGTAPQIYAAYWTPPAWDLFPGYRSAIRAVYIDYMQLGWKPVDIYPVIDLWKGVDHRWPTRLEIESFADEVHEQGNESMSAWSYQHMDVQRWSEWAGAGRLHRPRVPDSGHEGQEALELAVANLWLGQDIQLTKSALGILGKQGAVDWVQLEKVTKCAQEVVKKRKV